MARSKRNRPVRTIPDVAFELQYDHETGVLTRNGREAGCLRADGGYRVISVGNRHFLAHRVAWFLHYKTQPPPVVDHINGRKDDNRICNLREASCSESAWNTGLGARNKSGVKGVGWDRYHGKWRARIMADGSELTVGYFDSIELARLAIEAKRAELHGVFAKHE